jgi:AcrR family transcriptional regulator
MTRYSGEMGTFGDSPDQKSGTGDQEGAPAPLIRPSLRDDARSQARARIIDGAMVAIAASGLDATIDEVALRSGVSRRTVFRHFANHGELIAATIDEGLRYLGANLPSAPPPGVDTRTWLNESVVTLHDQTRRLLGRAFWDFHIDRPHQPAEVTAALLDVMEFRYGFARKFSNAAWVAVGGQGEAPQLVLDAFTFHISGFAAFAVNEKSPEESGEISARILWVVLMSALAEQESVSS